MWCVFVNSCGQTPKLGYAPRGGDIRLQHMRPARAATITTMGRERRAVTHPGDGVHLDERAALVIAPDPARVGIDPLDSRRFLFETVDQAPLS